MFLIWILIFFLHLSFQSLLADGQLSPKRAEQLKDLQKQVGLADASAEKIIKQITSGKMAGAIAKSVQMGQFSINDIRGLKDAGLKIENLVTKPARVQLFKKLISEQLASGTGQFDEELITKTIPEDLALSVEEAQSLLKAAASDKVKDALVQAISMLRQKQKDKVVGTIICFTVVLPLFLYSIFYLAVDPR